MGTNLHTLGNRRSSTRQRRSVRPRIGPSRVRWDRIGRFALVIVLFGVAVSYLNPAMNLFHSWQDSRTSKERLIELRAENQQLRQQLDEASNPAAIEREARRLGMARYSERAYVVRSR